MIEAISTATDYSRRRGATLFWLTLAIVLASPLPFGSNRPWSWNLLVVLAGCLLVLWSLGHLRSAGRPAVAPRRIWLPAALFLATCLFALLQTVPLLPDSAAHPLRSLDRLIGQSSDLAPISLSPGDTRGALLRLLAYGAIFWLVLQGARDGRRADRAVGAIAIASGLYSAYGVAVVLSGNEAILWFDKWAYLDTVTSTFVNRNSFATYCGLGILCALAYLFRALNRIAIDQSSLKRFVGDLLGGMTPWIMGAMAAVPLNLAGLFLTQSRAGILSSALALVVFLVGLSFKLRARRLAALVFSGLTLLAALYYFAVSGAGFIERLETLIGSDLAGNARLIVYRATIGGILESPWLGVGYGTFEDFFRTLRSPEMPGRFIKAHNTYLENALELGIPAATSLVLAIALLARRALSGIRRQRSAFVYGWMGFCATVLVGCHALVDFSLQIPAVAVTFATILAVGCSQSWSSRVDTSA